MTTTIIYDAAECTLLIQTDQQKSCAVAQLLHFQGVHRGVLLRYETHAGEYLLPLRQRTRCVALCPYSAAPCEMADGSRGQGAHPFLNLLQPLQLLLETCNCTGQGQGYYLCDIVLVILLQWFVSYVSINGNNNQQTLSALICPG